MPQRARRCGARQAAATDQVRGGRRSARLLAAVARDGVVAEDPSSTSATSSMSAEVKRQDCEHGAREPHGRASAAELPELLGNIANEHRAARSGPAAPAPSRRRDRLAELVTPCVSSASLWRRCTSRVASAPRPVAMDDFIPHSVLISAWSAWGSRVAWAPLL